jgi:hypothetical protein
MLFDYILRRLRTSSTDWAESNNGRVRLSVPRNGSIKGTFLMVVFPTSKRIELQLAA